MPKVIWVATEQITINAKGSPRVTVAPGEELPEVGSAQLEQLKKNNAISPRSKAEGEILKKERAKPPSGEVANEKGKFLKPKE